jgi:putative peptide zinc metalloprotease protein
MPQRLGGQSLWTFKDPVSLKYFHFSEEERFLFDQLDGHTSLEDIQSRFEDRFAPNRIGFAQLHAFLGNLHREGLLLGDTSGQSQVLLDRRRKHVRRQRWSRAASILAIRFRGVDAQPFLNWLYPRFRWLFSRGATASAALLVLAAAVHVGIHWRQFAAGLPEFEQFLSGSNVFWLAATIAGVKILHELAHGLSLKHFGGECHEIGPMLLLLTPCLYCNTTDAWMLSNKWQRAAVSAAGIMLEVFLASAATFLWWWSEPGLFHSLCMNVMIVCSVSTVLFNGNPLLRYDGYYVLTDIAEIPNLSQQAADTTRGLLASWFLGLRIPSDRIYLRHRQRAWLVAYHVASSSYRVIIVANILWGLSHLLAPYRLGALATGLSFMAVSGMLVAPSARLFTFLKDPRWKDQIYFNRLYRRSSFAVLVLLAILFTPLPSSIKAPAVLRYATAERVYVVVAGTIVSTKQPGDEVRIGDVIATLQNPDVLSLAERALADRNLQRVRVQNLERQAIVSTDAADQIPSAKAALVDYEKRLEERTADLRRLSILAPCDGTVLSPPRLDALTTSPTDLSEWRGSPLERINSGALLKTGTLLCLIGDPENTEALALVNQKDVELIRPGAATTLAINLYPGRTFSGKLVEISPSRVDELPQELQGAADLPQRETAAGVSVPLERIYQARILIEPGGTHLLAGSIGTAKIRTPSRSLAGRLVRFLQSTFRVRWPHSS